MGPSNQHASSETLSTPRICLWLPQQEKLPEPPFRISILNGSDIRHHLTLSIFQSVVNGQGSSNYSSFCDSPNCAIWQRAPEENLKLLLRSNRLTTTSNSLPTKFDCRVCAGLELLKIFFEASNSLWDKMLSEENRSLPQLAPRPTALRGSDNSHFVTSTNPALVV